MSRSPALCILALTAGQPPAGELPEPRAAYVTTASLPSPSATQAAAADGRFVYAVSDSLVVKHDRATGKELAKRTGKAQHLNSAFHWQGRLYCAHSNYPRTPHQSDVRVLDPETMELKVFHAFAEPPGSLTWVVRRGEHWWCHFAHYCAPYGVDTGPTRKRIIPHDFQGTARSGLLGDTP